MNPGIMIGININPSFCKGSSNIKQKITADTAPDAPRLR